MISEDVFKDVYVFFTLQAALVFLLVGASFVPISARSTKDGSLNKITIHDCTSKKSTNSHTAIPREHFVRTGI